MKDSPRPHGSLPPWEWPGAVRRDCEPHRGTLLHLLPVWVLMLTVLGAFTVITAAPGMLLSVLVYLMARRDLRLMTRRLMDPGGRAVTTRARATSGWCAVVNAAALLVWGAIYLLVLGRFAAR